MPKIFHLSIAFSMVTLLSFSSVNASKPGLTAFASAAASKSSTPAQTSVISALLKINGQGRWMYAGNVGAKQLENLVNSNIPLKLATVLVPVGIVYSGIQPKKGTPFSHEEPHPDLGESVPGYLPIEMLEGKQEGDDMELQIKNPETHQIFTINAKCHQYIIHNLELTDDPNFHQRFLLGKYSFGRNPVMPECDFSTEDADALVQAGVLEKYAEGDGQGRAHLNHRGQPVYGYKHGSNGFSLSRGDQSEENKAYAAQILTLRHCGPSIPSASTAQ